MAQWWSQLSTIPLMLGRNRYVAALLRILCLIALGIFHLFVAGVIWVCVMWLEIASIAIDERGKNYIREFRDPGSARNGSIASTDEILSKYWTSLFVVGAAMLLGALARFWAKSRYFGQNGSNLRSALPGLVKTAISCGGLTAATFAASIAVIQATVVDEKRLPPGSTQTETMVWLSFILVYVIVVAAYVGALDQITKKP